MIVKEKLEVLHEKIKSFEYIPKDIDNGMLEYLEKDIKSLRDLIGNASSHDGTLNNGDKELYLREFDRPLAILYRFGKQSTPEERLSKLPFIKSNVNSGVELFLTACETANSDILLQEESQIPDVSYPYIIIESLDPGSGV
jgi:hypothetical protein